MHTSSVPGSVLGVGVEEVHRMNDHHPVERAPRPAGLSAVDVSGTADGTGTRGEEQTRFCVSRSKCQDTQSHKYSLTHGDMTRDVETLRDGVWPVMRVVTDKGMARKGDKVRHGNVVNGKVPMIVQRCSVSLLYVMW